MDYSLLLFILSRTHLMETASLEPALLCIWASREIIAWMGIHHVDALPSFLFSTHSFRLCTCSMRSMDGVINSVYFPCIILRNSSAAFQSLSACIYRIFCRTQLDGEEKPFSLAFFSPSSAWRDLHILPFSRSSRIARIVSPAAYMYTCIIGPLVGLWTAAVAEQSPPALGCF